MADESRWVDGLHSTSMQSANCLYMHTAIRLASPTVAWVVKIARSTKTRTATPWLKELTLPVMM